MELARPIECPYCGQRFDLVVDTAAGNQQFVTDCEICCKPFEVIVECRPGVIVSLNTRESA